MEDSGPVLRPHAPVAAPRAADVVVGAVVAGRAAAVRATEYTAAMAGITARLAWQGSAPLRALVPSRVRVVIRGVADVVESDLRSRVDALAERGDLERRRQASALAGLLDRLVPLIVAEVVARIDLTRLVAENVDLDALAARIDIDAIVERLDLAEITDDVLDELDLPEIIRESTGSLGSAAMTDLRLRGIDADDAITGLVERILRRRRR